MADRFELTSSDLYRHTDPDSLSFDTTAELEPLDGVAGQPRAVDALELGLGMSDDGFNVFALGPRGSGRHYAVEHSVARHAADRPVPEDVCYVHNFQQPHEPALLTLSPGRGRRLAADMENMVRELPTALTAAFEGDEYQSRRGALEEEFRERQSELFQEIQEQAAERDLATLRTPGGIGFAPRKDGEVLDRDDFLALSDEQRAEFEAAIQEMQQEVQRTMRQVPGWLREHREKVRQLNREMTRFAVGPLFDELQERYAGEERVVAYLEAAAEDVVEHARAFLHEQGQDGDGNGQGNSSAVGGVGEPPSLRRYGVNVIVDHGGQSGAPIVHEDHPTYTNLVGRVEYQPRMGALVTDFNLIKPGALHRADGGYLVLEAEKVLRQPFAWDGLKRALAAGRLRIESPGQAVGLLSTVTLEPEPMPLDVKVVLIGSRRIYYLLSSLDPEFDDLFKVMADFDDRFQRTPENEALYGRLIASLAQEGGLLPFEAGAVARLIELGARDLGDAERLSTRTEMLDDLMREANHYARDDDRKAVTAGDVERTADARTRRANRAEERLREEILRRTLYVDTDGHKVGQINGLAVYSLGGYRFGQPSRITARVRMGKGEVVNIEREVKLSGPLHSKGVLILASFLAARYAAERSLSLAASLVFEQSYGGVDGDSASVAELVCLLSAIARVPVRQAIAITGSVDQHGRVQPIGGVNQKIEGFFEVCSERGLTGYQGVIVPRANAKHLMLARTVVEAVEEGHFHVWAVAHVDEAAEILTGLAAGERDESGAYPTGTLNRLVEDRLAELAEKRRKLAAKAKTAANDGEDGGNEDSDTNGDATDDDGDGDDDGEPPFPPTDPPEPPPEPPAEED